MKKLPGRLLIIALTSTLLVGWQGSKIKSEGVTDIKDLRNYKPHEPDVTTHKPFDIEVTRIVFLCDNAYQITYYQNENGSLNTHTAYYCREESFDKAAYKWMNDTTVSVRLYNEASKEQLECIVFGNGKTSGIVTPDIPVFDPLKLSKEDLQNIKIFNDLKGQPRLAEFKKISNIFPSCKTETKRIDSIATIFFKEETLTLIMNTDQLEQLIGKPDNDYNCSYELGRKGDPCLVSFCPNENKLSRQVVYINCIN